MPLPPPVPERSPDRLVRYAVDGPLASVTLDSPHNRNALSRRLVAELHAALSRAEQDAAVRVVLLRSEGSTFCSGADLEEAADGGMEQGAAELVALQRRILALPKPVVARVRGGVRAGGIGLVAAADVAVTTHDATFAFPEVRLGLAPAVISLTVLPRMTSREAALRLLGGVVFDGRAAERAGLVTRSVEADRLDAEVATVCAALAEGTPQGLRETKRLLAGPVLEDLDARGSRLARQSADLFSSPEARAALQALLARLGSPR